MPAKNNDLTVVTPVAPEVGDWTPDQIELIKAMCVPPQASDDEFKVLLYTAAKYKLDPLVKQIYMQKYRKGQDWAPATIMITYAGMQEIANREDMLDGIKATPFFMPDNKTVLGARSVLWKKGHAHPFETEVYFDEYAQMYNGKPSGLWGTKPITMICKVANAQNLRQAFSLGQMYTEEEMPTAETAVPFSRQEDPTPPATLAHTQFDSMKVAPVRTTPVVPEPEMESSVADRINVARKIFDQTGVLTVYNTLGTWLEISEQQTADALFKMVGAATIPQAAAMLGLGKFGDIIKANFPDAQPPRLKGGPAQQYSALLHYVYDYVERQEQHKKAQATTRAKMSEAEELFGVTSL